MTEPIKVHPAILVSAVRYAMGRSTYIVSMTAESVRDAWPHLDDKSRETIHRDLTEALEAADANNYSLGMAQDHADWQSLLRWIHVEG